MKERDRRRKDCLWGCGAVAAVASSTPSVYPL